MSIGRPYLCTAAATCTASSRVGTRMRPRTPLPFGAAPSRCSMGSAKAAVLPVPVAAWPSTSRPSTRGGIAARWMGVGSS